MKNLFGLLVVGCVVSSFALLGCPADDEPSASGQVFQCNGDTSTAPDTFCAEFDASVTEANARSYCESDMVDGEFTGDGSRNSALNRSGKSAAPK